MALITLVLALASSLPLAPRPEAPFPAIITDAPVITDVAPGVKFGDYEMRTVNGPLSIHVLAIDSQNPTIRFGTALANDRLISPGETVSSMALRTGAVAGINGDFFDINQTNQPLNILISQSRLLHMPVQRYAIAFDKDKNARFAEFTVSANVTLPQGVLPLKTLNLWPPPGEGAVLITPEFGTLHPAENVTEVQLQLDDGTPPFARYRVTGIADNTQVQPPGYYLAIGPDAYGSVALPNPGDVLSVTATATPSLDDVVWAIGGGPLIVRDGAWYADPHAPSNGEFATHLPVSAVGVTAAGTLLMFEVDGRQPSLSIGVLRPQLASLMIAFGAQTGMEFDGGGSSTIVARLPGDEVARVQNSPSDGKERRISDALLVYSDAPAGPASRIYAMPQVVRAMPAARVPLRVAITDSSGRRADCECTVRMGVLPASAGIIDGDTFVAGKRDQDAVIHIDAGELHQDVPVHVTSSVAYAQILPPYPALLANQELQLRARAFDARGYPIALPPQLDWSSTTGRIDSGGAFVAENRNADVSVTLGSTRAIQTVTVGEHAQALPLPRYIQFATAPRGGPGGVSKDESCPGCLTLRYDFTGDERAAYADASMLLPQRALAVAADVFGDGNGEILRLAVTNAINERFLYTMGTVTWHGWRHVEFRFPPALPQPITLKSLYVINRVGPASPVRAAGSIALRDIRVILAGSEQNVP